MMMTYWVSWYQGRISLGRGTIKYQKTLLDVSDTGLSNVYALGFSSAQNKEATFDLLASIGQL